MILYGYLLPTLCVVQVIGAPGKMAATVTSIYRSADTSTLRTPSRSWSVQKEPSEDVIAFPSSDEDDSASPKSVVPCPKGRAYCENVKNYPSDYLQRISRDSFAQFRNFFVNDTLTEPEDILSTKIDKVEEQPLCLSEERILFPQKAKSIDNETKYIVNSGDYWQGVRVEVCRNTNSSCQFNESFPQGYRTVCRQKHISRKLVVFNPNSKQQDLNTSEFLFPSCCVCRTIQL